PLAQIPECQDRLPAVRDALRDRKPGRDKPPSSRTHHRRAEVRDPRFQHARLPEQAAGHPATRASLASDVPEKIAKHPVAMFREDRFGMKLHAECWMQ